MNFPAYVPVAVRAHITNIIHGEIKGSGLEVALASAERTLAEIEEAIAATPRRGAAARLEVLRIQRAEAAKHRDRLAGDIAAMLRLAQDERMRAAYALLIPQIFDDRQWVAFIRSAWSADMDYAKFREKLKKAADLTDKIAKTAEVLADALREFAETGVDGPSEFDSIRWLLNSSSHPSGHRDSDHWKIRKHKVLGDVRGGGEQRHTTMNRMGRGPMSMSLSVHAADDLSDVWTLAPSVADLIDALAGSARGFTPKERGVLGAATKSRQRNRKTEYLRAFGNLLTDHGFALTTSIVQAMTVAANVVINDPSIDVTYDDVRKVLAKLGGERLENSGEK